MLKVGVSMPLLDATLKDRSGSTVSLDSGRLRLNADGSATVDGVPSGRLDGIWRHVRIEGTTGNGVMVEMDACCVLERSVLFFEFEARCLSLSLRRDGGRSGDNEDDDAENSVRWQLSRTSLAIPSLGGHWYSVYDHGLLRRGIDPHEHRPEGDGFALPLEGGGQIGLHVSEEMIGAPPLDAQGYRVKSKRHLSSAFMKCQEGVDVEKAQHSLEMLLLCLSYLEQKWISIRSRTVTRQGRDCAFDSWRVSVSDRPPTRRHEVQFNHLEQVATEVIGASRRIESSPRLFRAIIEPFVLAGSQVDAVASFLLLHTSAEALKSLYCQSKGENPRNSSFVSTMIEACGAWGVEVDEGELRAMREHRNRLVHKGETDGEFEGWSFGDAWRWLLAFVRRSIAGALGHPGLADVAHHLAR